MLARFLRVNLCLPLPEREERLFRWQDVPGFSGICEPGSAVTRTPCTVGSFTAYGGSLSAGQWDEADESPWFERIFWGLNLLALFGEIVKQWDEMATLEFMGSVGWMGIARVVGATCDLIVSGRCASGN